MFCNCLCTTQKLEYLWAFCDTAAARPMQDERRKAEWRKYRKSEGPKERGQVQPSREGILLTGNHYQEVPVMDHIQRHHQQVSPPNRRGLKWFILGEVSFQLNIVPPFPPPQQNNPLFRFSPSLSLAPSSTRVTSTMAAVRCCAVSTTTTMTPATMESPLASLPS